MRHRDSPTVGLVALFVLGSGFAALLDQSAWFRLLRGVFGASTAAHAAVVACFLGGLGLGAQHFGRRADRTANPLRLYALLEAGAALATALTPLVIEIAERPYHALAARLALGSVSRTLLRLTVTALVLGVPTFLMGGALPAAIRAVERDDDHARRRVGWLYGANTLGALSGALAAAFVALEALGNRATAWLGAGTGLAVAGAALLAARSRPARRSHADAAGVEDPALVEVAPEVRTRRVASACLAAALAGLAFGLLELVWYRMLAPLLGGSTYTFGLILALALAGTGLGGLGYALVRRRAPVGFASLALVSAVEALAIAAPLAAGDRLAVLALATRGLGDAGFGALALVWAALAAIVVVPASLAAGFQFPLLVALAGEGRHAAGRESGAVFAWNAAGNVVGALAGGLVLVPMLGALASWRFAAAAVLVLAGASAALAWRGAGSRRAALVALAGVACGGALTAAPGPTAAWRHQPIGVGAVPRAFPSLVARHDYLNAVRRALVWERDGRESAIGISSQDGDALLVNGKSDGNVRTDAPTQVMGGLIPAAIHPAPRLALVIGFGTGSTAGWLAQVPGIERVDVVELEPAVLEVARRNAVSTRDVLANPRVRLIFADAREALLELPDRYDVIFSEPSNPYRAGVASLFSLDFFRAVAERLAPGGLFAEWLQVYDLDAATVRSVYATLGAAFGNVETWETQLATDLLLVASAAPIDHDEVRIEARVASEPFRRALDVAWGVEGLAGLYTGFVADPSFARSLVVSGAVPPPVNTDDRNVLEFAAARSLARRDGLTVGELRAGAVTVGASRPAGTLGIDWARVAELRRARVLAEEGAAASVLAGSDPSAPLDALAGARQQARLAYARGDLARAAWLWPGFTSAAEPPLAPDSLPPADRVVVAELLASQADPRAPAWIDALAEGRPATAECLWTILAAARRERASSAAHGLEALRLLRADPWVHRPLVLRVLSVLYAESARDPAFARAFFAALGEPLAARVLEDTRITLRAQVGLSADFGGLCAEALAPVEPWPPWNRELLAARARCYEERRDPRRARAVRELAAFDAESAADPRGAPRAR